MFESSQDEEKPEDDQIDSSAKPKGKPDAKSTLLGKRAASRNPDLPETAGDPAKPPPKAMKTEPVPPKEAGDTKPAT